MFNVSWETTNNINVSLVVKKTNSNTTLSPWQQVNLLCWDGLASSSEKITDNLSSSVVSLIQPRRKQIETKFTNK